MAISKMIIVRRALLVMILMGSSAIAPASDLNPLKPVDTSSPRATFFGFLELMDAAHQRGIGIIETYLHSSRLFFTHEEFASLMNTRKYLFAANRTLDLSALPQAMELESARKLTIQLKEVLDRIELPGKLQIPDAQAMADTTSVKWTLPNTEITLARVETGERSDEYLFSTATVARIPEFYDEVKDRPYVSETTKNWYSHQTKTPLVVALALHKVIPPRWILQGHSAEEKIVLGEPLWRWAGLLITLSLSVLFIKLAGRFEARFRKDRPTPRAWARVCRPGSIAIVTYLAINVLANVLRFEGFVYRFLIPGLWAFHFAALTWLVWVVGEAIAQSIISTERLKQSSIQSQLIRLILRLANLGGAIFIIILGADRIGLPSYSVVASLGVGGLAVALAAQQTVANLIGSIIIMLEKPFMIGDSVKIADAEGVVRSVGFRSTRIKSPNGTVVTIPSSQIVNNAVTNRGHADQLTVCNTLNLEISTPPEVLEAFVNDLHAKLKSIPDIDPQHTRVGLSGIFGSRLELTFTFQMKDAGSQDLIQKRQWLLIDILKMAQAQGLKLI